jgi:hypothetical protein
MFSGKNQKYTVLKKEKNIFKKKKKMKRIKKRSCYCQKEAPRN